MTQVEALATELTKHGLKANTWKGRRVYLNGCGKDIAAYIELDDPTAEKWDYLYQGCALKVFSNAAQGSQWRINRAKQVKHSLMLQLSDAGVWPDPKGESVCEDWRDVIL